MLLRQLYLIGVIIKKMMYAKHPPAILMNINLLFIRRNKKSWDIEDEYSEAMAQPRYRQDAISYRNYINTRKFVYNFSGNTVLSGGFEISDNDHPMTLIIGKAWYSEILKSGIEDQLSLAFIYERYSDYIGVLRGIDGRPSKELFGM